MRIKVQACGICHSDSLVKEGHWPGLQFPRVPGHEVVGSVDAVGPGVSQWKAGRRVGVGWHGGHCGQCAACETQMFSLCENSNPNAWLAEKMLGHPTAGIYGYSHMMGGFAGGQAEYARVPFADVGPIKVPEGVPDDQVLFLSDIFPTGYMGAEMCNIKQGDTIAVWGCGPVRQSAIKIAYLLGAERVIAIDRFPERLRMAREQGGAETIDYEEVDVHDALKEMTGGRGPDACIDAVGMEAHGTGPDYYYDRAKQALRLETDRPHVLRQAIRACRKGGTVAVMGVYGGFVDKFPIGALMNKALTLHSGQMHGQRYAPRLFEYIQQGRLDPSYLLTHRMALEDGPRGYAMFRDKEDRCVRAVFAP